jgi:uncharacterized membrane protein YgcG
LKASSFDTVTVTVTPTESTSSGIEWYWILLIVVGVILLVCVTGYIMMAKGYVYSTGDENTTNFDPKQLERDSGSNKGWSSTRWIEDD